MTTITNAHRAEARRRLEALGFMASTISLDLINAFAQALAEPAWQPPVDPDLIEARECAAVYFETKGDLIWPRQFRSGGHDHIDAVQSALIAIKRRQSNG